ncbi:MAG: DUF411 domain-containing protein [Scytonema sp. PMC 1069.18]|nr:DUF411 domain-containing protein [Scytonema sp. PMC 1069.18]MEC4883528.1 DUF411 domain-containing protein [Scytonema sp. PMC 1070.18]
MQKHFPFWVRKWLRHVLTRIVKVGMVVTACLTMSIMGASESHALNHTSQVVAQVMNANNDISQFGTNSSPELDITVYRSPYCGCCGGWVEHLRAQGFQTTEIKTEHMEAIKQKYRIPQDMASCHTAVINGYVIEGHVPSKDIKQLISKKLSVVGITVPGMPIGSPGMEVGNKKEPFNVVSFDKKGNLKVLSQYSS